MGETHTGQHAEIGEIEKEKEGEPVVFEATFEYADLVPLTTGISVSAAQRSARWWKD